MEQLTVPKDGMKLVPELYLVPDESLLEEQAYPGTQERVPGGRCPFMWAQGLHVVSHLLVGGLITPAELDPLNRRLSIVR